MLAEKIREDMKDAMRAKDQLRVDTLRGALAAFTNDLVAKGKKPTEEVTDVDATAVLKRLAKQRKEAADQYVKGGRTELAQKELAELKLLESYLPKMASREEIERVAQLKKEELGITDSAGAGKLIGAIVKSFAGAVNGDDVKEVVQNLFS